MATTRSRQLFVNLPTKDLARSMEFFSKLGFEYDKRFTDDNAACMIVDPDHAYVMLLAEPFFKTFIEKEVCDATVRTEAIIAISCDSRDEVAAMVDKAVAAGGTRAMGPKDHGFMCYDSFYDLDGHSWEVLWMDPAGPPSA